MSNQSNKELRIKYTKTLKKIRKEFNIRKGKDYGEYLQLYKKRHGLKVNKLLNYYE